MDGYIWILTCTRQGQEKQVWYFTTLKDAQEHQRNAHEGYMLGWLANANRIKGALRGKGQASLSALASGIVADNLQFNITSRVIQNWDYDTLSQTITKQHMEDIVGRSIDSHEWWKFLQQTGDGFADAASELAREWFQGKEDE